MDCWKGIIVPVWVEGEIIQVLGLLGERDPNPNTAADQNTDFCTEK